PPKERPLGRLTGPSVPVPSPTVLRIPEGLHRRELPLSDESDPSPNLSRTTCSQSLVAQFLQRCSSSYQPSCLNQFEGMIPGSIGLCLLPRETTVQAEKQGICPLFLPTEFSTAC